MAANGGRDVTNFPGDGESAFLKNHTPYTSTTHADSRNNACVLFAVLLMLVSCVCGFVFLFWLERIDDFEAFGTKGPESAARSTSPIGKPPVPGIALFYVCDAIAATKSLQYTAPLGKSLARYDE